MTDTDFYNKHHIKVETGTVEDVLQLFNVNKTSQRIEEELSSSSNSSTTPNNGKISLTSPTGTNTPSTDTSTPSTAEVKSPSDYYGSADLVLRLLNTGLRLATNWYLANEGLDKVTKEEFEPDSTSKKLMKVSLADVLHKYRFFIGVEMNALMTIAGVYQGMISNTIDKKKMEKLEKENEILKKKYEELKKKKGGNSDKDEKEEKMQVVKESKKEESKKGKRSLTSDKKTTDKKVSNNNGIDLLGND